MKTPAWVRPQARTETPSPPVTASRPITSHLCRSLLSPSSCFLSLFLRLRGSSAHFVSTGLLPGSHPDIRHMSPRLPRPRCLEPDAVKAQSGETLLHMTNNSPYSLIPRVKEPCLQKRKRFSLYIKLLHLYKILLHLSTSAVLFVALIKRSLKNHNYSGCCCFCARFCFIFIF